ncbi:MAG: tetratricopeptide repeat protein [Planctomycetaceae bacterium]|nr:tetratricopeptide repeat protein [Planctomycetaceae bacterium]
MPATPSGASGRTTGAATIDGASAQSPESVWIARQVEAMVTAWGLGERLTAAEILERHPGLDPEAAIRLIYEEVCLCRESGQEVATAEVVRRFPQWKDELELVLGCDRLMRPPALAAAFPEVGDTLGPFRLRAELGRGASGRTYLASESALADRPVVVKVIPDEHDEHLSLARLQHTHIVPLFSEQALPDRGLRALCMPYLGGASLARILEPLSSVPPDRRRGRHLVEALDRAQAGSWTPTVADKPYRRYLEQATYVQAICWIAACLADALQYAHARGLVHMDVKPSNVLIAGDGQPMLLDFHLARSPIEPGEWVGDRLGGTHGWMSPEQEAAMVAVGRGRPIPRAIDRLSDLYSLGLLLCEALGGPGAAAEGAAGRPWQLRNPGVSVGLAAIVRKCLAPAPADRYRDAAALAEDLRRHLNDQPLRGVANRSLIERLRKWRRRSPGALARGTALLSLAAAVVVAVGLVVAFAHQRTREGEAALADGRKLCGEGRFLEAVQVLEHGREVARSVPFPHPFLGHLADDLDLQLRRARRGLKAAELHRLADLIRFRYGVAPPATEDAREVALLCRTIWDGRDVLLVPDDRALAPEAEQQIRTDLLELAFVLAGLRIRLASPGAVAEAHQDALRVLDEAESALGPSPAIDRERRAAAATPGRPEPSDAPEAAPRSAWEHYNLGRSYLRSDQVARAVEEFRRTLELRPEDFWSNFYEGLCAYRLGHFAEAVAAFRACIALRPDSAECYFNRGLAAEALRRPEQARRDYSRALAIDPHLTAAALNRGILAYNEGRHAEAIADLLHALHTTSDPETIGRIHYSLAMAYKAGGDPASARRSVEEALRRGYRDARALADHLR